jgi:hypothetical protein
VSEDGCACSVIMHAQQLPYDISSQTPFASRAWRSVHTSMAFTLEHGEHQELAARGTNAELEI